MSAATKKTSGTRIELRSGSEGPRFDPYHFVEIEVERNDKRVVGHQGLISWLEVNGVRVDFYDDKVFEAAFEDACGISASDCELWYHTARSRCRKCGCRSLHDEAGFPGESFSVCDRCGEIVATDFNMSAIE